MCTNNIQIQSQVGNLLKKWTYELQKAQTLQC